MKKKLLWGVGEAVILIMAMLGCQTAKPALVTPAESAIQVEKSGFSPSGTAGQTSIDISLLYGNRGSIKSWKVEAVKRRHRAKDMDGRREVPPGQPELGRQERLRGDGARGHLHGEALHRLRIEVQAGVG